MQHLDVQLARELLKGKLPPDDQARWMAHVDACQRWTHGRGSYRVAGEPIDTRRYEVAPIADDTTPKRFVVQHHYSGTYPAARFRFGLFHRSGALEGVAVFSVPPRDRRHLRGRARPYPKIDLRSAA